jgi:hypothetical protein
VTTDITESTCATPPQLARTASAATGSQPNVIVHEEISIQEARARYAKDGRDAVYPGYRSVIKSLVGDGYSGQFRNDSYADALFLTDIMFEHADKAVRMLTGGGGDGFIETLAARFEEMLERLQRVGGEVRIIMLSTEIPKFLQQLSERFASTLRIARAKASDKMKHFIVCDTHMVRLEELHDELTPATPASAIKANVTFNDRVQAKVAEDYFDTLWERVRQRP